ncbi:MAG: hypothetical protein B6U78_00710 [Candidatus Aenigmarchaeota archaeon ex4484_224]|nr:MAG: hypothetical protein B6U78_00710 [Candidatus Aenigmarchaeota archaeon ex4484_224]
MEQKILVKKDKPIIICDYREKRIIEILKNKKDVKILKMNLPIGDFIVENIGIERKSYDDFISSIIDKRIFEQVENLKEKFEKSILIIEGFSFNRIHENAFFGALAYFATKNISIIWTKNENETANFIYWLAKKVFEKKEEFPKIKISKKKKEIRELQEQIVASLPKVREILAKRLLKHFGSVENVFKASEYELKKVKGIGDKLAKEIRKIISAKYE